MTMSFKVFNFKLKNNNKRVKIIITQSFKRHYTIVVVRK